jgi:hypothetical protein
VRDLWRMRSGALLALEPRKTTCPWIGPTCSRRTCRRRQIRSAPLVVRWASLRRPLRPRLAPLLIFSTTRTRRSGGVVAISWPSSNLAIPGRPSRASASPLGGSIGPIPVRGLGSTCCTRTGTQSGPFERTAGHIARVRRQGRALPRTLRSRCARTCSAGSFPTVTANAPADDSPPPANVPRPRQPSSVGARFVGAPCRVHYPADKRRSRAASVRALSRNVACTSSIKSAALAPTCIAPRPWPRLSR